MDIIDHIAIKVSDLKLAETWYLGHLHAEITFRDEKFYPHEHIGILVENYEDLPDFGQRVQHRDGTVGVYVKDPFGNYLEYIWYSPDQSETFLK